MFIIFQIPERKNPDKIILKELFVLNKISYVFYPSWERRNGRPIQFTSNLDQEWERSK